jgi:hypothetical protein
MMTSFDRQVCNPSSIASMIGERYFLMTFKKIHGRGPRCEDRINHWRGLHRAMRLHDLHRLEPGCPVTHHRSRLRRSISPSSPSVSGWYRAALHRAGSIAIIRSKRQCTDRAGIAIALVLPTSWDKITPCCRPPRDCIDRRGRLVASLICP